MGKKESNVSFNYHNLLSGSSMVRVLISPEFIEWWVRFSKTVVGYNYLFYLKKQRRGKL